MGLGLRLVLFDLDGTLLKTGGIGRRSTRDALEEVFGTSGDLDDFYPGGRTQEAIFADTLDDAGIGEEQYRQKKDHLYQVFLDAFRKYGESGEYEISVLPGATRLIKYLKKSENYALGLVTGNHEQIAVLKMQYAGLNPSDFLAGGFGQESADRTDLVPLAKRRVEEILNIQFPGYSTIVIGDTTRDVLSAKSVDAISFALTTGTDDYELLRSVNPDSIFDDLYQVLERFEFLEGRIGGINGI